jgi:uncharacterized protein DUF6502
VLVKSQDRQEDVLVEFLSEFANHLLNCGITMTEFRIAAQAAFVQAALSSARLQNSRVNQSAVAAVTGLSRPQVRALMRTPTEGGAPISTRINSVISGWRSDPDFTDTDGNPLALSIGRSRNSFSALIKKYGRDVSHRAMLSEMRRMGFVRQAAGSVNLQKMSAPAKQPEMTRLLSQGLTHIIRQGTHADAAVINVITGEATYDVPDSASRVLLRRRLVQGTKAFAADLQAASDASSSRQKKKSGARKVSTRILVVTVG